MTDTQELNREEKGLHPTTNRQWLKMMVVFCFIHNALGG